MSEVIVSKAGGTSNATPEAVRHSMYWAELSDIFTVSAPGRLDGDELESEKVTDLLLTAQRSYDSSGRVMRGVKGAVTERYTNIVRGLGHSTVSKHWLNGINHRIEDSVRLGEDATSMLGERLQAEIYEGLGFTLLDPTSAPEDLGNSPDAWQSWLGSVFTKGKKYILPGNTTRLASKPSTFDRGGSDISGGLAAFAVNADLHYNLTDGAAMSADPRLIPRERLRPIAHMLYTEGRELGRNGTGLVHPAAMIPLMRGGIQTEVRSTFKRGEQPTVLDNDIERAAARCGQVVALSLMEGVVIHKVYEPEMAESFGRLADLEASIASQGIPLIDSKGYGVDAQKYFIRAEHAEVAYDALSKVVRHGHIESTTDVDLVTLVGHDLHTRIIDHIMNLALYSGMDAKRWQAQRHDLSPGEHSLRISLDSASSRAIFDQLHEHFLE